ncbi:MAG TPA: isoprenylcysteine carboxylmethyltransferase family protein [Terriglobales bacterium]|nr:isoprenylcysteine carboxylmethyltransferase family protein [Terriglobales bacterium]
MATLLTPDVAARVGFYAVIVCWWIFGLTFWLRKRPPRAREAKRDWTSLVGLLLQTAGYFCVWSFPLQRKHFLPVTPELPVVEWGLVVLSVSIAVVSVWLVNAAARRLGKQWALAARLVEGHTLIQDGPYRFVRNPIYAGMFGMLLATGLALTQWTPLLVGIALFIPGTYIRIRSEERLLREAFGSEFEAYAHRVPALIPGIY